MPCCQRAHFASRSSKSTSLLADRRLQLPFSRVEQTEGEAILAGRGASGDSEPVQRASRDHAVLVVAEHALNALEVLDRPTHVRRGAAAQFSGVPRALGSLARLVKQHAVARPDRFGQSPIRLALRLAGPLVDLLARRGCG